MEVGEVCHDEGEEVGGHGHALRVHIHHVVTVQLHGGRLHHVGQGHHLPESVEGDLTLPKHNTVPKMK